MGCESVKEKVEDEMLKMKLEREEIRTERYKILKILNEFDGGSRKAAVIPDYIDPEFSNKNSSKPINNQEINKGNTKKRRSNRSKSTKAFIPNKHNIIYNNKIFNFEEDEDDKNDKENINIRKGKKRRTHKRKTMKY